MNLSIPDPQVPGPEHKWGLVLGPLAGREVSSQSGTRLCVRHRVGASAKAGRGLTPLNPLNSLKQEPSSPPSAEGDDITASFRGGSSPHTPESP